MSNEFESKYKKDSDNIEICFSLDNYVLLPDSRVKCNIFLKPKYSFKLGKLDQEIILKLTQFEKCEFNSKRGESKSKNRETLLLKKNFIKHFPDIISKKILIKDIEFEVPSSNNNLLIPTFEYRKKETNLFIRHLLTLEIPCFEIVESIGVIICKIPDKIYKLEKKNSNIFKDEDVNTFFGLKNEGKISYNISLKKQIYNPKEEIPLIININSKELRNISVESIEIIFQKKITIYAYPIDTEEKTILDKKTFKNLKSESKIMKVNTQLKFENKDIRELSEREIEKYSHFDENFLERDDNRIQLTPSMSGNLFKCEYKAKINIIFDNIYRKTINEFFIIDIYDIYNINPESIPNNLKHYFLIKENSFFISQNTDNKENFNKDEVDNKIKKNENDINGFELIDHEDFISTFEGKKTNNKDIKK